MLESAMPCLVVAIALAFPRLIIGCAWLFSNWFAGVFPTLVWPVLGFLFLPTTLLWYVGVQKWYGGQWTAMPIAGLVIALILDGVPGTLHRIRRRPQPE